MYRRLLALVLVLGLTLATMYAQVFREGVPLWYIETEHFTIIYTRGTEETAQRLKDLAESVLAEISAELQAELPFKIPVVITPDTDSLNGFFTISPVAHIVLYQAAISPNQGFAQYNDVLRKLFLHELTHAVSILQKDAFSSFISALFGDIVSPAFLSHLSFIEGVTVSFESRDGFGRARDAQVAARIQQSILENKFPTFVQASGARDGYPFGAWYHFGGWFSRYLQETYGMDAYAKLWKAFGSGSGAYDFLWFPGAFRSVYPLDLDLAWLAFRDWMKLATKPEAAGQQVSKGLASIYATAALGSKLWWGDGMWVKEYDTAAQEPKIKNLFRSDSSLTRIAPSKDGRYLLLSMSQQHDDFETWVLRTFDLEKNAFVAAKWPEHLSEAAWLTDGSGVVAVQTRGYTLDLVRVDLDGTSKVLFQGSELAIPSQPCPMDDGSLVFLLQLEGKNHLARLNAEGSRFEFIDEARLGSIRMLNSDGQDLYFSWDSDFTLLKLARLEGSSLELYPSMFGGVQHPVGLNDGTIYYRADFAQGQAIAALPELSTEKIDINFEPLPTKYQSGLDLTALDESPLDQASLQISGAKSYNAFAAALFPGIRMPVFTLDAYDTSGDFLKSAGLMFMGGDPTGLFAWNAALEYHWKAQFVSGVGNISFNGLPFSTTVSGFDSLQYLPIEFGGNSRVTGGQLLASDIWYGDISSRTFTLSLLAGFQQTASQATALSPYTWPVERQVVPLGISATYKDAFKDSYTRERSGYQVGVNWSGMLDLESTVSGPLSVAYASVDTWLPFLKFHASPSLAVAVHPSVSLTPSGTVWGMSQVSGLSIYPQTYLYRDWNDAFGTMLAMFEFDVGHRLELGFDIGRVIYVHAAEAQLAYKSWLPLSGIEPGPYLDLINFKLGLDIRAIVLPPLASNGFLVGVEVQKALRSQDIVVNFLFTSNLY